MQNEFGHQDPRELHPIFNRLNPTNVLCVRSSRTLSRCRWFHSFIDLLQNISTPSVMQDSFKFIVKIFRNYISMFPVCLCAYNQIANRQHKVPQSGSVLTYIPPKNSSFKPLINPRSSMGNLSNLAYHCQNACLSQKEPSSNNKHISLGHLVHIPMAIPGRFVHSNLYGEIQ